MAAMRPSATSTVMSARAGEPVASMTLTWVIASGLTRTVWLECAAASSTNNSRSEQINFFIAWLRLNLKMRAGTSRNYSYRALPVTSLLSEFNESQLSSRIFSISRHASTRVAAFCSAPRSPLFELARVLMRLDHVASFIVNADHSIV
jgi:hypothetical protein